jgi:RraA family protein
VTDRLTIPGWRENPTPDRPDAELLASLAGLQVALLGDNSARATGAFGLHPRSARAELVGSAVTVRTRAGDNLAIYRAFAHCRPGDVLVIDGAGALDQALMGEIMITYAVSIGVVGIVIDGAVRDLAAIREMQTPVFARGVTHRGPYKNGPGEINVAVSIGGMVVNPGDVVVGDDDGLIALAPSDIPQVAAAARRQEQAEQSKLAAIANGSYDLSWVQRATREAIG